MNETKTNAEKDTNSLFIKKKERNRFKGLSNWFLNANSHLKFDWKVMRPFTTYQRTGLWSTGLPGHLTGFVFKCNVSHLLSTYYVPGIFQCTILVKPSDPLNCNCSSINLFMQLHEENWLKKLSNLPGSQSLEVVKSNFFFLNTRHLILKSILLSTINKLLIWNSF